MDINRYKCYVVVAWNTVFYEKHPTILPCVLCKNGLAERSVPHKTAHHITLCSMHKWSRKTHTVAMQPQTKIA